MTRAERKVLLDRVVDENSKDSEPLRQAVKDRLDRHNPSPLTPWAASAQWASATEQAAHSRAGHAVRICCWGCTLGMRTAPGPHMPRPDLILWSHTCFVTSAYRECKCTRLRCQTLQEHTPVARVWRRQAVESSAGEVHSTLCGRRLNNSQHWTNLGI